MILFDTSKSELWLIYNKETMLALGHRSVKKLSFWLPDDDPHFATKKSFLENIAEKIFEKLDLSLDNRALIAYNIHRIQRSIK